MANSRNRVKNELGKGVESLRNARLALTDALAGSVTYVGAIGPFEVDIDVEEIAITSGIIPAADGANTLDIFNGTVLAAVTLMTQLTDALLVYGWGAQTVGVPVKPPVIVAAKRVHAGTPIIIRFVAAGDNSAAPSTINVRVGYDIPIYDKDAKIHTYGAYDDGQ